MTLSDEDIQRILSCEPRQASALDQALAKAIRDGDTNLVNALLDQGADLNADRSDSFSPLCIAIEHEQIEVIKVLLRRGAHVNLPLRGGFTPLHLAIDVEGDHAQQAREQTPTAHVTNLLLEAGANPLGDSPEGQRPIDIARKYGHVEAVRLLEKYGR